MAEAKDEGGRATASTSAEVSVAQLAQTESLLKVIDAALRRLDEGTFGECLNCGQEIGKKRTGGDSVGPVLRHLPGVD